MKLGVILVHGIATESPDWAAGIVPVVRDVVLAELRGLLKEGVPPAAEDALVIESVYWADILNENQKKLFDRLKEAQEPLVLQGSWKQKLWALFKHFSREAEFGFITKSMADIIGYLQDDARGLIHGRVLEAIGRVSGRMGNSSGKAPLTIVAHSLGTVVSSECVYDRTKERRQRQLEGFHDLARLVNFFTLGSPLALFSLQSGDADAFREPIRVEELTGRWVNIYDKDDPVGMPLKTLNKEYGEAVLRDVRVESGGYLVAHTRYFTAGQTLKIIGRKLAIDWIALNERLPKDDLGRLYSEYDQNLGIR